MLFGKTRLWHLVWVVLLLFSLSECGPKNDRHGSRPSENRESNQVVEVAKGGKGTKSPKVAVFLDYTSSMRGFYKTGDVTQNVGKLMTAAGTNSAPIEFWKYGRMNLKAKGNVCVQIPAAETQNVDNFLDDNKFNWIANDYVIAIERMVQLSLADKEKVSILLTDGIPSEVGGVEIDGGDHSSMQINITNGLSKFAADPNAACTILSLNAKFDGTVFYADGQKARHNGNRPYFLVMIYHKDQSGLVKTLCNSLSGISSQYSYNNHLMGFYELSSGKITKNIRGQAGHNFVFIATQAPLGPAREQFNTSMLSVAKAEAADKSIALSWVVKPLPNNKVMEVSAPVMDKVESYEGKEFIITYKAPKPFGILSKGFDSDPGQAPPEFLSAKSHELQNTSARDLNILIEGIYEAFANKPGAIHKFTAPKNLSE
jgi:hypothetical protein